MRTIKQVEIEPVFVEKYIPKQSEMEPNKIYISREFETSSHLCLCGCGRLTVLPLKPNSGWVLQEHQSGKVSFSPSVGNFQLPCRSHYIITKNKANFV